MAQYSADTIRILVATDNHVGYAEDNPIRCDDGWRTFDEIMQIAETQDVDMVLLGGDLFHDHQPSQKSLYHVMESLRKHCLGNKPCSIDIIGDESEHFRGQFNHANYNDPNLNVSIPVFSIHGNHDEPNGQASLASLDLLQTSGLINYFGRQPEADKIKIKPILMQKGTTKLALYGLSNVRDERLFQTFRSHNVKFLQPSVHRDEWYNLLAVHQNHTAHSDQGYLPEAFLPDFMDMVIWGHEHQCLIDPVENPTKGFKVIQPGSSIATSLSPSEADPKHVCILNITGRECKVEPIPLKTVRPYIYHDIALSASKEMVAVAHKSDNLAHVKKYCKKVVDELIKKANTQWLQANQDSIDEEDGPLTPPLPLIRLRVEFTAPPSGGEFKVEQNRRFSREYSEVVANDTDLFYFHRKRSASKRITSTAVLPDDAVLEATTADTVKIGNLVAEYLGVQTMTLLPRNLFNDAVEQFVEKNDKNALAVFVKDTYKTSIDGLLEEDTVDVEQDDTSLEDAMTRIREQQEQRLLAGEFQAVDGGRVRPDDWDNAKDGDWDDIPNAATEAMLLDSDNHSNAVIETRGAKSKLPTAKKAEGKAAAAKKATAPKKAAAAKKAAPKKPAAKGRGKKKMPIADEDDSDDEEDEDSPMLDDGNSDDIEIVGDSGGLFVSQASSVPARRAPARATTSRAKPAAAQGTQSGGNNSTQTRLNFGNFANGTGVSSNRAPARMPDPMLDDEISDDDAFEALSPTARTVRRR